MPTNYEYRVAISFAEEDRNAALALALAFELKGISNVYYYPDQPAATTGKILNDELEEIYGRKSQYTVILASEKYFNKPIAQVELNAICRRMDQQPKVQCVILVKLNDALDLSKHAYLNKLGYVLWSFNPKNIADILKVNLGSPRTDKNKGANLELLTVNINQNNIDGNYQSNDSTINLWPTK